MTRFLHADVAVPGETSLSGTRVSLHADAARPSGIAALALHALSPGELDGSAEIVRAVLPAPDADGPFAVGWRGRHDRVRLTRAGRQGRHRRWEEPRRPSLARRFGCGVRLRHPTVGAGRRPEVLALQLRATKLLGDVTSAAATRRDEDEQASMRPR